MLQSTSADISTKAKGLSVRAGKPPTDPDKWLAHGGGVGGTGDLQCLNSEGCFGSGVHVGILFIACFFASLWETLHKTKEFLPIPRLSFLPYAIFHLPMHNSQDTQNEQKMMSLLFFPFSPMPRARYRGVHLLAIPGTIVDTCVCSLCDEKSPHPLLSFHPSLAKTERLCFLLSVHSGL